MRSFALALALAIAALPAIAETPPSDVEILQAEVQANAAQLVYASKVIARMQADAKALAEYWSAYVGRQPVQHESP